MDPVSIVCLCIGIGFAVFYVVVMARNQIKNKFMKYVLKR